VFHALDEKHIKSIAKIQLGLLEQRLASLDMKLEVSDAVLAELADTGFDPIYGARPLKRAIQSAIENPLAKEILEGRFAPKDTILVNLKDGRVTFGKRVSPEAKAA
jgi:ATP-dependent Clp protease ATP-binding subunit ClpB